MALNSFALSAGANVSVGTTPIAVQITGATIVITNVGAATVYGSCGGSTPALNLATAGYITGLPAGNATNAGQVANGTAGIAILPAPTGDIVVLATGGNGFLWLATTAGTGVVNVAQGT